MHVGGTFIRQMMAGKLLLPLQFVLQFHLKIAFPISYFTAVLVQLLVEAFC